MASGDPARRRRVIINTDAKNEADDQYAIVHALLSPTIDVRGLIAAHFGRERSERSMQDSREEIDLLLGLLGPRVMSGSPTAHPGGSRDQSTPIDSDGAQLIIAESKLAGAGDPLYVAFLGPLTDMASAILLDPEIVRRDVDRDLDRRTGLRRSTPRIRASSSTCATTSPPPTSCSTPGSPSGRCRPMSMSNVSVGYAELEEKIAGTSRLADYLISQLVEFNETWNREPIESRSLGDSPAVSLILFPRGGTFRTVPAPRFGQEGHYIPGSGNPVKVCESVDVRFLLEDMFAKIRRFGRRPAITRPPEQRGDADRTRPLSYQPTRTNVRRQRRL